MKEFGEGVAVLFAKGHEDGDGYRQNSDFFFLTGVNEPDAVLVLAPKERTYREFLFLPSRDPEAERWTGERDPIGAALRKKHGIDRIFRTGRLTGLVMDLAARSPVLWQVSLPESGEEQKAADLELYGKVSAKLAGVSTRALPHTLARMRSRHSAGEIALIQRAVRISEEGFRAAVMAIRPGGFEGRVEAEAERVWKSLGARRPAYPSIVGSGPNSTILHYPRSERILQDGDLILMDMSAEFAHTRRTSRARCPSTESSRRSSARFTTLYCWRRRRLLRWCGPGVFRGFGRGGAQGDFGSGLRRLFHPRSRAFRGLGRA
jgi:Xaa-Pro aminopeptidase